jgi:diketogulonate reductase-like aldo/keto reductase
MANQIPLKTLNNGVGIPLLGFGTFKKGRTPGVTYQAVLAALNAGYRHIDGAWL